MRIARFCLSAAVFTFAIAANAFAQTSASGSNSFVAHWQARVTATQNAQPHWVTPLVTVTPRLEQEVRTDFLHEYDGSHHWLWNYDNGAKDGFGDVSFLLKERLFSRNEEHGNAVVTAFLGASVPTGKNKNGSCCAIVTPTVAMGKGFGRFDVTTTAGGSLPVTNAVGLGHTITWNAVAQYRLAAHGFARFFWPEIESNASFYKGGTNDGKVADYLTPGLIFGRVPLSHDGAGNPGRLGLTFGAGEQIADTHFHTYNHITVLTARVPF